MAHLLSTPMLLATPSSTNKENLIVVPKKSQQNTLAEARAFGTVITNQPSASEKVKFPLVSQNQTTNPQQKASLVQEPQWDNEFEVSDIDFTYTSPTPAFLDPLTEDVDFSKLRHPYHYSRSTPSLEDLLTCDEVSYQSDSDIQGAYFSSEESIELPPTGFYTEPM
ncbi:uncharacterized protein LOC126327193 [Schistocerca gregaria]|uniref:uncharacterized protein LOC126327193 n=1 Tax=Schistocerca gregaria TaxID=7010 RepID=UPI00211F31FF|nr:uncharacterized protein LOC126327193 [Schistocerca gregaria]